MIKIKRENRLYLVWSFGDNSSVPCIGSYLLLGHFWTYSIGLWWFRSFRWICSWLGLRSIKIFNRVIARWWAHQFEDVSNNLSWRRILVIIWLIQTTFGYPKSIWFVIICIAIESNVYANHSEWFEWFLSAAFCFHYFAFIQHINVLTCFWSEYINWEHRKHLWRLHPVIEKKPMIENDQNKEGK